MHLPCMGSVCLRDAAKATPTTQTPNRAIPNHRDLCYRLHRHPDGRRMGRCRRILVEYKRRDPAGRVRRQAGKHGLRIRHRQSGQNGPIQSNRSVRSCPHLALLSLLRRHGHREREEHRKFLRRSRADPAPGRITRLRCAGFFLVGNTPVDAGETVSSTLQCVNALLRFAIYTSDEIQTERCRSGRSA